VDIFQCLFNWRDEAVYDFTRLLGSLFPVVSEGDHKVIKPYHKSLADWLADEGKAGPYFVSVAEGHRLLANFGWIQVRGNHTNSAVRQFFFRHLPVHLHFAHQYPRLFKLLRDQGYISSPDSSIWRLPSEVRAWLPMGVQQNEDVIRRLPGRWYQLHFENSGHCSLAPDYECCNCGFSEIVYKLDKNGRCPKCGWAGDNVERKAFDELESQYSKPPG
jgi:hypothetical protein